MTASTPGSTPMRVVSTCYKRAGTAQHSTNIIGVSVVDRLGGRTHTVSLADGSRSHVVAEPLGDHFEEYLVCMG